MDGSNLAIERPTNISHHHENSVKWCCCISAQRTVNLLKQIKTNYTRTKTNALDKMLIRRYISSI